MIRRTTGMPFSELWHVRWNYETMDERGMEWHEYALDGLSFSYLLHFHSWDKAHFLYQDLTLAVCSLYFYRFWPPSYTCDENDDFVY
jgi:hypothetical protein